MCIQNYQKMILQNNLFLYSTKKQAYLSWFGRANLRKMILEFMSLHIHSVITPSIIKKEESWE